MPPVLCMGTGTDAPSPPSLREPTEAGRDAACLGHRIKAKMAEDVEAEFVTSNRRETARQKYSNAAVSPPANP